MLTAHCTARWQARALARMAPWILVSPYLVQYYVVDDVALRTLAMCRHVRPDHLEQLVGLKATTYGSHESGQKQSSAKKRGNWILLSDVKWIRREDTHELVPVGADIDFFVRGIASRRDDMAHFTAARLRLFLSGQLFNSGKCVDIYAARGKEARLRAWRVVDAPADASKRIQSVPAPSPFALPAHTPTIGESANTSTAPATAANSVTDASTVASNPANTTTSVSASTAAITATMVTDAAEPLGALAQTFAGSRVNDDQIMLEDFLTFNWGPEEAHRVMHGDGADSSTKVATGDCVTCETCDGSASDASLCDGQVQVPLCDVVTPVQVIRDALTPATNDACASARGCENCDSCVGLAPGKGWGRAPRGKTGQGNKTVSVAAAQVAIQRATEAGTIAGVQMGVELATEQFAAEKQAAVDAAVAQKTAEMEVEQAVVTKSLTTEISEMEDIIWHVTESRLAAERTFESRISILQGELGLAEASQRKTEPTKLEQEWLARAGEASKSKAQVKSLQAQSEADRAKLRELNDLLGVGPRLRAKGDELLGQLGSAEETRSAMLHDQLAMSTPTTAADVDLTERRVDQLVAHCEQQLFAAGAGDVARTKLLVAALVKRPAVQRLLSRHDERAQKLSTAASAMISHAKGVLAQLTTGKRGSRSLEDHLRFETIVAALVPDGATEDRMLRAIGELLGLHWEQIDRAQKRNDTNNGAAGSFSNATKVSRKQRKDYRGWGRRVAIGYWHKATRLDTNVNKKKRHREVNITTGDIFYREHWRHVQYDIDEQIADDFFASVDYQQYLKEGGLPFKRDIFLQAKCFCIEKSDFQECTCPPCTLMRETLRDFHQQRAKWHREYDKEGAAPCSCGECAKGGAYREASGSLGKLRAFVHAKCGKQSFPELAIDAGPKKTQEVLFYRRQCCRAPLPSEACPDGKAQECGDCSVCGWAATMPKCPIEYSDEKDAEWKEYQPRIEPDGRSFKDELVSITGTRKQLMERLAKLFEDWSPHDWTDRWNTHARHLTYATFSDDETCISTDFSAQYDHKAFCTRTCEHPSRSNMDVFVVTHSPRIEHGERVVTTDIWRIFSEAKGSSLFHNQALDDIVKYYQGKLPIKLKRVFVFSDGCRAQYKGKKNFVRVAQFPSRKEMHGAHLIHRFAASHHFKGPHDAYGKDAKHLCRTAERNQKARLASTHDIYYFCAKNLPKPRRDVTAKQIAAALPTQPEVAPPPLSAAERAAAEEALAAAPTKEAAVAIAERLAEARIEVVPLHEEEEEAAAAAPEEESDGDRDGGGEANGGESAEADGDADVDADGDDDQAEAAAAAAAYDAALLDAEPEEDVADDFIFNENGARVGDDHFDEPSAAEHVSDVEMADAETTPSAAVGGKRVQEDAGGLPPKPPPKLARTARTLQILTQAPGTEAGAAGVLRTEVQKATRGTGMFSASNYFWLYYAAAGVRGLTEQVEVGTLAEKGQYHAILDDTADVEADSITGSNSTYEFAGVDAERPELLYTRIYPCVCRRCREPSAVRSEYASCPYMTTVGKFQQHAIHEATGVTRQKQVQKAKVEVFGRGIVPDHLYAAYASHEERGARKYWLLRTASKMYSAKKAIKVAGGTTIRKGTKVVDAEWYLSTSDTQERKSYTLLEGEKVTVPVAALVQEHELEWARNMRHATGCELILSDASHIALMLHNYSNVA